MKNRNHNSTNSGKVFNKVVYGYRRINGELLACFADGGERKEMTLHADSVTACVKEMRAAGLVVTSVAVRRLKLCF